MIVYLLATIIEAIFVFFLKIIHGVLVTAGISVNFSSLAQNDGFMFAVSFLDKVLGWTFLINALGVAVTIAVVIKLTRLIIGLISKG
jgi:hypothetical protein